MRRPRHIQGSTATPRKNTSPRVRKMSMDQEEPMDSKNRVFMTKSIFNQHLAQVGLEPMYALAKRISKDNNGPEVNKAALLRYMENMDWSAAAFQLQKHPARSKRQKVNWVDKYLVEPIFKYLHLNVQSRKLWAVVGASLVAVKIYARYMANKEGWADAVTNLANQTIFRG